jgi:oligoribonuclease (3'-5' exoribonuclease)
METGYHDGNGRVEFTGRRLDGQRTVENFGNWKALTEATNWMMMMMKTWLPSFELCSSSIMSDKSQIFANMPQLSSYAYIC